MERGQEGSRGRSGSSRLAGQCLSPAAQGHELALCNGHAVPAVRLLAGPLDPNNHSAPPAPDDVEDGAGAVLRAGLHQSLHDACNARKSDSSHAQSSAPQYAGS